VVPSPSSSVAQRGRRTKDRGTWDGPSTKARRTEARPAVDATKSGRVVTARLRATPVSRGISNRDSAGRLRGDVRLYAMNLSTAEERSTRTYSVKLLAVKLISDRERAVYTDVSRHVLATARPQHE
jgi:hypothetical protein